MAIKANWKKCSERAPEGAIGTALGRVWFWDASYNYGQPALVEVKKARWLAERYPAGQWAPLERPQPPQ